MPKKSTKSKAKKTTSNIFVKLVEQHPNITFFLVLIFVVVLSIFITIQVNNYQDEKESQKIHAQLEEVDKKMQTEFNAILQQVGEPTHKESTKNCTYPNTKGDPGDPSCGPDYTAYYGFDTREQSDAGLASVKKAMNEQLHINIDRGFSNYVGDPTGFSESKSTDVYINGTHCKAQVVRDEPDSDAHVIRQPVYVMIFYYCNKVSPKPVYPVYDYNI